MKILVCISNVPDTTTKVKFTDGKKAFDTTGVQWIINPWDELALTRALVLKEDTDTLVDQVSVINVGPKDTEPTIRKAMAIGADDAIRVDTEPLDAFYVAAQIAEAIRNEGYDIILSGIESSDYNGSAVGGMVAEFLDIPSISAVSSLIIKNGQVTMNRDIDGGKEVVNVSLPFVAIVQKGIAIEPRIPSMRGIMMARKKPLKVVAAAEIKPLTEYTEFKLPQPKQPCKMVDPENVKELIKLLKEEAKVL